MVDRAKAAFQNLKKYFSKKKNELKSQANQIFTRRIKSYLKKDPLLASFIFCIKLLNTPFSSCLENNSRTHIFLFLLFFSFTLKKTTSCKNKIPFPSESDMMPKELQNSDSIFVNLMTDVFKIIVKYRHLSPSVNRALVI